MLPLPDQPLPDIASPQVPVPNPPGDIEAPIPPLPPIIPAVQAPPDAPQVDPAVPVVQVHPEAPLHTPDPDAPVMDPPAPVMDPLAPVMDPPAPVPPHRGQGADSDETRHSLRLKLKDTQGGTSKNKRGNRNTTSGTDIIQQFPYVNLSDKEIISLFEVSGLGLGSSFEDKLKVVQHLRLLSRSRFSTACSDLVATKSPDLFATPPPSLDISSTILDISPEIPSYLDD